MSWASVPDWLLPWPQFTVLLSGYLVRLGKLAPLEVEKSWLARACQTARERPEARQHFDALEEAASYCDDAARGVLTKKFEGTLPRSPAAWNRDHDDRFHDVIVELAAYRWLRREYPTSDLEYVEASNGRSPDLQVTTDTDAVGVECKNMHMSNAARSVLDAGGMLSGSVEMPQAFIDQIQQKMDDATEQLAGHQTKIVFLNVALDPFLWPIESAVGDAIEAISPAGCTLLVFLNYGWAEPRWMFQR